MFVGKLLVRPRRMKSKRRKRSAVSVSPKKRSERLNVSGNGKKKRTKSSRRDASARRRSVRLVRRKRLSLPLTRQREKWPSGSSKRRMSARRNLLRSGKRSLRKKLVNLLLSNSNNSEPLPSNLLVHQLLLEMRRLLGLLSVLPTILRRRRSLTSLHLSPRQLFLLKLVRNSRDLQW